MRQLTPKRQVLFVADIGVSDCTTRFENAHRTVLREVLYRHHPWFGRRVCIHGAVDKGSFVVFRCTLDGSQADRWLEVPAWMFDRTAYPDPGLVGQVDLFLFVPDVVRQFVVEFGKIGKFRMALDLARLSAQNDPILSRVGHADELKRVEQFLETDGHCGALAMPDGRAAHQVLAGRSWYLTRSMTPSASAIL